MKQTPKAWRQSVAQSIDVPLRALPLAPELFEPLTALGSQPRLVLAWLRAARVGAGHRVLDLGCGKGAVAVAIADRLQCHVTGVDAFEPFIQAAQQHAIRRRAQERCHFRLQRLEVWRRVRAAYDAVIMLGVWPVQRAAPLARRLTRVGGVYLIDDAVRADRKTGDSSAHEAPSAAEVRRMLETTGDCVERAQIVSPRLLRRRESVLYERLRRQAARISRREPWARPLLTECLERQRVAVRLLTGPLRPALWLVRRTS